jgi:hypothetical protein
MMPARREKWPTRTAIAMILPDREPWLTRALRFGRALIVGSGATLTDFSVFTTCVRAIDRDAPEQACTLEVA